MKFERTITTKAKPDVSKPPGDGPGELERGTTIGHFVLLRTLRAYDPELDRKVALKQLLPPTTWRLIVVRVRSAGSMEDTVATAEVPPGTDAADVNRRGQPEAPG